MEKSLFPFIRDSVYYSILEDERLTVKQRLQTLLNKRAILLQLFYEKQNRSDRL